MQKLIENPVEFFFWGNLGDLNFLVGLKKKIYIYIYIYTVHFYVTGNESCCFYENYIKVQIFFEMLFFKVIVIQT